MDSSDTVVSVCLIIRNERSRIVDVLERYTTVLAQSFIYYELVMIDNASNDGTDLLIVSELRHFPNVRLLRLSRIHDRMTVARAAMDNAIGDYVILNDLDVELSIIPRLVNKAQEGYDVVIVRRNL